MPTKSAQPPEIPQSWQRLAVRTKSAKDQNPEAQARAAVAAAVNLARGRAYDDGLRELLGNDCTDPEQPFVLRVPVEAVTA